jgi:hypothetical protein
MQSKQSECTQEQDSWNGSAGKNFFQGGTSMAKKKAKKKATKKKAKKKK